MIRRLRLALLTPLAAASAFAVPAFAGSIEVGPITVQMLGSERTSTLTIRNASAAAESLQVRTVEWSQKDGQDVYAPSKALIASPPVVKLGPGETQKIRLVLENVPDAQRESAYRLILDELPTTPNIKGSGVKTTVRVLVPVFLTPSAQVQAKLRWSAARSPAGLVVTAANEGDARERLTGLTFVADGQPVGGGAAFNGYVLSHSSRSWTLAAPAGVSALTAKAAGINGAVEAHVPIGP